MGTAQKGLGGPPRRGLKAAPLIAFACALFALGYIALLALALSHGTWLVDRHGAPAPADFNGLWGAARLSTQGLAESAYHWPAMERVLAGAGRASDPRLQFPFYYPPVFLLELRLIGALPYAPALALWLSVTEATYLGAARLAGGRGLAAPLAVAAPAAFACVYVGQNGLLTAALAGAGLALIPPRPLLAGVLIGLIAYKPQFGPALPILLLAARRWATLAAATATVLLTYAAAGLALGWDVYAAWLQVLAPGPGGVSAIADLPVTKLQSIYGLARAFGGSAPLAWAAQGSAALGAIVLAARLWSASSPWPLKSAAAIAVMLIVSPYSVLYDYALLSMAFAFLAADVRRSRLAALQAGALALGFGAPLASTAFTLPLCPIGALLVLAVALVRAEVLITKVSPRPSHPTEVAPAS